MAAPVSYSIPSQISKWNVEQDQLALVYTNVLGREDFRSELQDYCSVVQTVKPSPIIGPVKDAHNHKKNLLGFPTHTSYQECGKDMEMHSSVQKGLFCTAEAEEKGHMRVTSNFSKGRSKQTKLVIQSPTTFHYLHLNRNNQFNRGELPKMTVVNMRNNGSNLESLCSIEKQENQKSEYTSTRMIHKMGDEKSNHI